MAPHVQLDLVPKAMHVGSRGVDQEVRLSPDVGEQRMFPGQGIGQKKSLAREGVGPARLPEAAMERGRFRIKIENFKG
jgi:hypothetical protein